MQNFIHARPFVPQCMHSYNNNVNQFHVQLNSKCILLPEECVYIQAKSCIPENLLHSRMLFSNDNCTSNLIFEESLHSFSPEDCFSINGEDLSEENSNVNISFFIVAKNNTDAKVILPADHICGHLTEVDDIKPCFNQNILKNHNNHIEVVNLIVPTNEIANLRRREFHEANINNQHLEKDQQIKLKQVLENNFMAFSSSLKSMGHSDRIVPQINFTSDYPIKSLPFPIPQSLQAEAKRQLEEMEEAGIITKTIASWACPMLLVKKKIIENKPQTYRMALDLRLINTVIEHSSYPLPKISNIIHELAEFTYFTALDMPAAYHQLELPENVKERLSFTTPWSQYKCNRLPFGLKTSSSSFQALLDNIVSEVNLPGIFVYQDDIFIGTHSFEQTLVHLDKFLKVFAKYNLTLNLAKCSFHQTEINCLGFNISQQRIIPISSNIAKITSFPVPATKRQLKRFLGVCGFYRSLIPSYAKISEPLVKLTSPKVSFKWENSHQIAFDNMQKIFFNTPFLQQPDFRKPFYLNTDASNVAISAVLLQECNEHLLPVSYFSRSLKKTERNYPAIQLELMAIVKSIQAFKNILYGRKFIILSDSKPLEHYKRTTSPADLITRWLLQLSEYSFNFQHLPGKTNLLADFLSRTHLHKNTIDIQSDPSLLRSEEIVPVYEHTPVINHVESNQYSNNNSPNSQVCNEISAHPKQDACFEISQETIAYEQSIDPFISKTVNEINNNSCKNKSFSLCPTTNLLMFKSNKKNSDNRLKIVIPASLKEKCLRLFHFPHFGITKTYQKCSAIYHWRKMYKDVEKFVNSCDVCIQSKHHNIPKAPLQNNPIPSRPGEFISLDFVGPFENGKFILTVIDHFSKHLHLYVLKKITAMNTVQAMFDYFTIFGKPKLILTDNGRQFTSHMFKEFQTMLGVKLKKTSSYHPETNAVSERVNTSIKATIKSLMKDGYTFENAVKIHQSLYNSTFHSTIKTSPNHVHFGRDLGNLVDTFHPVDASLRLDVPNDYFNLINNLNILYNQIEQNLLNYQKLQNQKQNEKAKLRKFNIDDHVYLQQRGKIKTIYRGPFKIVKICSSVTYKIQLAADKESPILTVHVNRLISAPPPKRDTLSFPNNRPLGRVNDTYHSRDIRLQYNPANAQISHDNAEIFQTVPSMQQNILQNSGSNHDKVHDNSAQENVSPCPSVHSEGLCHNDSCDMPIISPMLLNESLSDANIRDTPPILDQYIDTHNSDNSTNENISPDNSLSINNTSLNSSHSSTKSITHSFPYVLRPREPRVKYCK